MTLERKNRTVNVALTLASIMFSIAIAETICRIIPLSHDSNPTYKLPHGTLPYVMKANSESTSIHGHLLKINSHGLRDFEYSYPKPDGVFRILVLGDSVTYAHGAKMEDGYAKVLERQLNALTKKKYEKIEVINSGHNGYNLLDEYNFLRLYGLKYAPDLLVVAVNMSDYHTNSLKLVIADGIDSAPGSLWVRLHVPAWVKRTLRQSHLYMVVGSSVGKISYRFRNQSQTAVPEDVLENMVEKTENTLESLVLLASQNNIPVSLTYTPSRSETMTKAYAVPLFNRLIENFAKSGRVTLIDLMESFSEFSDNPDYIFAIDDIIHPNAKGHKIIADHLYDSISNMLVCSPKTDPAAQPSKCI